MEESWTGKNKKGKSSWGSDSSSQEIGYGFELREEWHTYHVVVNFLN